MKRTLALATACLAMLAIVRPLSAAPSAAAATEKAGPLAKPTKLLFADDFARGDMKPKWRVGKGFWTLKDGVVTTAENPEDKHGAYAYVNPGFQYKDIVAEFTVKLEGSRSCSLMINDSKYKESHAGHILRVGVQQGNKISVADWKFGSMKNDIFEKMKDEKTSADEKKKLRDSIKDKQADFTVDQELTDWHRVRVEIIGDEMLVSIDGKPAAYLKSEGVAHPTKSAIGFEIGGKQTDIKDFKVFEAAPNADWSSKREAVIASLQK